MAKKILIVTDDAGESLEILYAQHRFIEAGYRPVIAATKKKRLNAVIHDFCPGWNTYVERPGYLIQADTSFSNVKAGDFVALLVAGGRAPEFLRHDKKLIRLVREFARLNKPIWSICHGIQVLITAGVVAGKRVTCYEHVKSEVATVGGKWVDKASVVDGKLITAQTWESHPAFHRNIFKSLESKS